MTDTSNSSASAAATATTSASSGTMQVVATKPTGLAGAWAKYLKSLERFPIRTKALTSAIVSVVADLIAQKLGGGAFNFSSLLKQFLIGLVVRGPVVHYWFESVCANFTGSISYQILESLFASQKQDALSTAVGKMVVDQAVFAPFFNGLYFFVRGFLDGESVAAIQTKLAADFASVMIANYKVWPLVNLINFKLIPANLRVLFGNLVGVAWTVLLITLTSGGAPPAAPVAAAAASAKQ